MTSLIIPWSLAFEAGPAVCGGKGYTVARLARTATHDPEALAWLQRQEPAQHWQQLPASSPFRNNGPPQS